MILKVLGWCPGVEAAVNFNRETGYSWRKAAFYIMLFSLVVYGSAYYIFLLPDSELEPLIITIDGVDVSQVDFSDYNFSSFYRKEVAFEMPIDYDEFAPPGTHGYVKTLYEAQSWDLAFSLLNETQTPNIVFSYARWLRNGTHIEVAKRYYGSISEYEKWSDADGTIQHYFGTSIERKTAYFNVLRAQIPYSLFSEFGVNERVEIQKNCFTNRGTNLIWILAIEIAEAPPYKVLFIQYGR